MSQFPQSFRSPSPATGPQAVRGQERKVPVGSGPTMMAQQRPKSASTVGAKPSQTNRISPVSGLPLSNLQSRRSPVMNERSNGAFEVRAPAASKQRRSTLAQGSATAGRRTSVSTAVGYGSFNISANGTPRTQYSDAVTPRGQGAPYTPSVTVNPNFDGQPKSSLGLRHQHAVKAGGIAYEVGPEMQASLHGEAAGAAAGQRRLLSMNQQGQGQRRSMAAGGGSAGSSLLSTSVLEAGSISVNHSLDMGSSRDVGSSVEHQRQSITQAIGLLENSQLLQQDAVLRDIVQIIVNRLNASPEKQQNPPQRVVVTSDNGTQVNSIETATQTEVPKFKEKRMQPLAKGKLRRVEGQNCSLSDSDVPSDQTETVDSQGLGRRRNSLDDISLSTNSPRESCDGYSRDTSEASGPASVSSMVQMSVASSTDASQTATLAHDQMTPLHASQFADQYDDMEALDDGVQGIELWDSKKVHYGVDVGVGGQDLESPGLRPVGGLKGCPPMSPLQALNVNLNHYIGTYQHELEGISELANSPDGHSLSPTEKQFLAMSPSPSIETLKELKRILDHHYTKLFQAGNPAAAHGINSPATAEMQRLSMESSLAAEDGQRVVDAETGRTPERPPNPDPTKWSPGAAGAVGKPQPPPRPVETSGFEVPRNIRMGNSPPKHKNVKTPLTQLRTVPQLNLPPARRQDSGTLESPLSTPRSGSAFLAHINSARSSTNSGSASSTPRLPQGAIKIESHGTTLTKAALEAQTSAQRM